MPRLVAIEARPPFRLWLRYDDGAEGEVDLSHLITGQVFEPWRDDSFFRSVTIGVHGEASWGESIDLCPDALYLRLTGKAAEQVMPGLQEAEVAA